MFAYTVTFGNILTLGSLIGGALIFTGSLKNTVRTLATRLVSVELELKKLSDVLIALGRQDERIVSVEKRVSLIEEDYRELRHGKGFITS